MKIIHATQKLIKELRVQPEEQVQPKYWLESWHANVFTVERHKCVLVTNDETLYSLFLPALKKDDFLHFKFIFNQRFFKFMLAAEIPQPLIEKALTNDNIAFAKSFDRSVVGVMNNLKQCIEAMIYVRGGLENCSMNELHHEINRIPWQKHGFQNAHEIFIQKLNES